MSVKDCFTKDELFHFLKDKLSDEKKEKVESHLRECQVCRHQLTLAYKRTLLPEPTLLIRAPRRLVTSVLRKPQSRFSRLFDWLFDYRKQVTATLAVFLIVSVTTIFFLSDSNRIRKPLASDPLRETKPISVAPQLLSPENDVQLNLENAVFRWSKVENISRYNFVFLDQRGNIILKTFTTQEKLTLSDVSVQLEKGKVYFWYIAAQLNDGTEADSEIRKFTFK